jgi:hypothetical protein
VAAMTYPLPRDVRQGALTPGGRWGFTGNVWSITFPAQNHARLIVRLVVLPPAGISTTVDLALWDEQERLTSAPSALSRGFSLLHPIPLPAGMTCYLVWGTATGTQPQASLYTMGQYM